MYNNPEDLGEIPLEASTMEPESSSLTYVSRRMIDNLQHDRGDSGSLTYGTAPNGMATRLGDSHQGQWSQIRVLPGHIAPGHIPPGHISPGHIGHISPGHILTGHILTGHILPVHILPVHILTGHILTGHILTGHISPGHIQIARS